MTNLSRKDLDWNFKANSFRTLNKEQFNYFLLSSCLWKAHRAVLISTKMSHGLLSRLCLMKVIFQITKGLNHRGSHTNYIH